jgi:GNAT superfamily N-acetyltransferase
MKLTEVPVTRTEFVNSLTEHKQDKFAKTFIAKCDMLQGWDNCIGVWSEGQLAAAIVVTISKKEPKVANLQLLHSFYEFRGKGAARMLCNWAVQHAIDNGAQYFRVSSELDAVEFYKKCGFQFVCKQKTCELSLFKLTSAIISENNFEPDEYVWKQMNRKGKGSCVECYFEYKGLENFAD